MADCIHWSDCGVIGGGCCALGEGGGRPHSSFCNHCKKISSNSVARNLELEAGRKKREKEGREAAERLLRTMRLCWRNLHHFMYYDHSPGERAAFMVRWTETIPQIGCVCREWYEAVLRQIPPPEPSADTNAWFAWTVRVHNSVNAKLNKPIMPLESAREQFVNPRKLILDMCMAPGDTVILTSTIRDLHAAYPGRFMTDVRAACDTSFFENCPLLSHIEDSDQDADRIHLSLAGEASPLHYTRQFTADLGRQLLIDIPFGAKKPVLWLSDEERRVRPFGFDYVVFISGGTTSFTVKWPDAKKIELAIREFPELKFVQVGEEGGLDPRHKHIHPRLTGDNIIDAVGLTTWRETIHLIAHAKFVICPITCCMHVAAALDVPAIVIGGGREHPDFVAHESTILLHRIGKFDCCEKKGCWLHRTVALGDGSGGDQRLCAHPVTKGDSRAVPACIDDISSEEIAAAMEPHDRSRNYGFVAQSPSGG